LFFFNDTATTEIYTLSLHDALPISPAVWVILDTGARAARANHQPPIPATRSRPGPANSNSAVSRPTEASTVSRDVATTTMRSGLEGSRSASTRKGSASGPRVTVQIGR